MASTGAFLYFWVDLGVQSPVKMRKNLAIVALFVFLCISLFLNLAAWGERIRLNGTIAELNEVLVYDLEYAKAVDNVREQLAHYAWYGDEMIDARQENDTARYGSNMVLKMSAAQYINNATESAKMVKDNRSEFIQNAKYVNQIN